MVKSFKPKQQNRSAGDRPGEFGMQQPVRQPNSSQGGELNLPRVDAPLRLIPLGGVGDVTKNMYVYEYKDDIVIIDCGVSFPEEGMLGVDLVIPDITYLKDKKHKIRGIIVTHGHDDHHGALPYIWPELRVPIYSQKLTCGLIKSKFIEHKLPKDAIKTLKIDDKLDLGVFKASFYQVSHSVPDSTGIVLETPVGTVIHQADFKIDWTPVNGQVTDVGRVAELGNSGVTLMSMDCLRVEKEGYTLSERNIEPAFSEIEKTTKGKLLITLITSNVTRLQQAINVAAKAGRKVALSGRSMENTAQVARDLGYLDIPAGILIAQEEIKRFPDNKLLILIAGSLGQPGSALSRVANNDHRFIRLKKEDTVVFSADPMPSAEFAQSVLIDEISRFGCRVFYSGLNPQLHVSGHAAREEMKLMLNLAKPKFVMPMGGTFKHIRAFEQLAQELGYNSSQVVTPQEVRVIEVFPDRIRYGDKVPNANIYVDGLGVGDVGSIILRDRQVMSEEGVVVVVVPLDQQTGKFAGEPDIISRGFVFGEKEGDMHEAAKEIVKSLFADRKAGFLDLRYIRHEIEDHLEKFFYEETKRNPLILTVITEV